MGNPSKEAKRRELAAARERCPVCGERPEVEYAQVGIATDRTSLYPYRVPALLRCPNEADEDHRAGC